MKNKFNIFILILIFLVFIYHSFNIDFFQNGNSFFVIESNDKNDNYISLRIPISKDYQKLNILDELKKCHSELDSINKPTNEEETIYSEKSKREQITEPDKLQTRGSTNPVGDNNTPTPSSIYSPEAQKLLDQTHKNMMALSSCKKK